jgi:hypothetical protein
MVDSKLHKIGKIHFVPCAAAGTHSPRLASRISKRLKGKNGECCFVNHSLQNHIPVYYFQKRAQHCSGLAPHCGLPTARIRRSQAPGSCLICAAAAAAAAEKGIGIVGVEGAIMNVTSCAVAAAAAAALGASVVYAVMSSRRPSSYDSSSERSSSPPLASSQSNVSLHLPLARDHDGCPWLPVPTPANTSASRHVIKADALEWLKQQSTLPGSVVTSLPDIGEVKLSRDECACLLLLDFLSQSIPPTSFKLHASTL